MLHLSLWIHVKVNYLGYGRCVVIIVISNLLLSNSLEHEKLTYRLTITLAIGKFTLICLHDTCSHSYMQVRTVDLGRPWLKKITQWNKTHLDQYRETAGR